MSKRNGPLSARDFQRVSKQRLSTAEFLCLWGYNRDAIYLAGYGIECSLKALILDLTPPAERLAGLQKITSGAKMHDFEILAGELRKFNFAIPQSLTRKFRRYPWSTNLRYETGRIPNSEARGFVKFANEFHEWMKGELS